MRIKQNALIPYFTLGDPNLGFTEKLVRAAFDSGADVVELGIPFSDPIADGPVIQASHQRALGATVDDGFALVAKFKGKPIVFMIAVNLVFHYGIAAFFKKAAQAGLAGVIVPDLPVEEAKDYIRYSKQYGIAMIFLVSPLCDPKRLKMIVQASEGFVYLISSTGTTGERKDISSDLESIVKKIKKIRNIPVAVGFGVSKKEHLEKIYAYAEGAIIGSYFVRMIEENPNQAIAQISAKVKEFKIVA